jgi:hypothetical protein
MGKGDSKMKRALSVCLLAGIVVATASAQTITVTDPASGASWKKGETHAITWTKDGSSISFPL